MERFGQWPGPRRSAGAAIIAAMLVVALAATLVAGMMWREEIQIRRVENQKLLAQTEFIMQGAIDWSRLILRASGDALPTVDYLGQPWSLPIAPTKLSDFLGQIGQVRAEEGASTSLSGQILDAQANFNLRNLVTSATPGVFTIDPLALAAYGRLLSFLGMDPQLAQITAEYVQASLAATLGNTGTGQAGGNAPLQIVSLDGLLNIPGYTSQMLPVLAGFVTVLPVATPVNANTAPAEVLAAVITGLSLAQAQTLVNARNQAFFRNSGDVTALLQSSNVQVPDTSVIDVRTHFFVVYGLIEHERAQVGSATLIYRSDVVPKSTIVVSVTDTP